MDDDKQFVSELAKATCRTVLGYLNRPEHNDVGPDGHDAHKLVEENGGCAVCGWSLPNASCEVLPGRTFRAMVMADLEDLDSVASLYVQRMVAFILEYMKENFPGVTVPEGQIILDDFPETVIMNLFDGTDNLQHMMRNTSESRLMPNSLKVYLLSLTSETPSQ